MPNYLDLLRLGAADSTEQRGGAAEIERLRTEAERSQAALKLQVEAHTLTAGVAEALMEDKKRLQREVDLQKQNVKYRDDIIGLSPNGDRHADLVREVERLQDENGQLCLWKDAAIREYPPIARELAGYQETPRETEQVKQIKELQAIIDQLEITKDGARVVPGMILYVPHPDSGTILSWQPETDSLRLESLDGENHWTIRPFQCQSTRAAAEAAQKGEASDG
jgi:hypothetical protein